MMEKINKLSGRIIKGIGGFYYIYCECDKIYECRAKGIFRNKKIKPLVGDYVEIEVIDSDKRTGNVITIKERKSELIRPASANVDQALVLFAGKDPDPNYILLDKFLITMNLMSLPVILCFNKTDLINEQERAELEKIYKDSCKLKFISLSEKTGLSGLLEDLQGKTTVLAGPSGAGKSTMLNYFCPDSDAKTGSVSEKIGRGRHTTRHSELFAINKDTFIMDTPGFSSMDINGINFKDLRFYYPEFDDYEGKCRFQGCVHVSEPECSVKEAVLEKKISKKRYESYCYLYEELKNIKKYK